ncbi:MAG: KH domain-containing protein [Patescibacteria group bacterium]|nr:KH domain-containing protein [Patescibacteria group bacterium]
MNNIDQEFIEFVVKSLVGNPAAVVVDRRIDEKGVLLELTVDPEDLGRVIGKRGATAQSLRTLLRALGTKNDARYNLKIVDNGVAHEQNGTDAPVVAQNTASDKTVQDASANEPAAMATPAAPSNTTPADDEDAQTSDRLRQARKELDDLDDLDI